LLVPKVAEELEEAARPVRAVGVADQELDVEVADDLHPAPVQLPIKVLEIPTALAEGFPGEFAVVPRLIGGGAIQVSTVPADLDDFRLDVLDEFEIAGVVIADQMVDKAREFDASRGLGRGSGGKQERRGEPETLDHGRPFKEIVRGGAGSAGV